MVFPNAAIPLFVGREKSIKALEAVASKYKKIILVAQKDAETDDPKDKDVYAYGTLGEILQLLKLPDGTVKILVEGKSIVKIKEFKKNEDFLLADCEELNSILKSLKQFLYPKLLLENTKSFRKFQKNLMMKITSILKTKQTQ